MNEENSPELSWKDKLVKIRDAALKVIYHPTVIKVSRFATDVLEATYVVDPKNPLSVGSAAMALIDSAVTAFELPQLSKIEHFAQSNNLTPYSGSLPKVMFEAKLYARYPTKTVLKLENNLLVKEVCINNTNKFYYLENIDTSAAFSDPADRIYYLFYTSEGFDFEKLFDAIWEFYAGGIFLSKITTSNNPQGSIKLNALMSSDYMYIGDLSVDTYAKDIINCRAENLSRSFMLVGAPGTGKSSFAINVAKQVSKRVLKVDPTATRMFGSVEFDFLIKNLKPDFIIFDDFDRAALAHDSEHLLFLLENMKSQSPNLVIFATVNEFYRLDKALVRPGRFDEIVWFDEPSLDSRSKVIEAYLNKYSLEVTKELVSDILNKTAGMSPVYIKELCLRMKRKGPGCIDTVINEFRRSMQVSESNDFANMDELGTLEGDAESQMLDLADVVSDEEMTMCEGAQDGLPDEFATGDEGSRFKRITKKKRRKKKLEDKPVRPLFRL